MDVCVLSFYVCVVLCVARGLATGWSPVQGALPTVYILRNWKSGQGPTKGCRAIIVQNFQVGPKPRQKQRVWFHAANTRRGSNLYYQSLC
jgi:hypothetical protein